MIQGQNSAFERLAKIHDTRTIEKNDSLSSDQSGQIKTPQIVQAKRLNKS